MIIHWLYNGCWPLPLRIPPEQELWNGSQGNAWIDLLHFIVYSIVIDCWKEDMVMPITMGEKIKIMLGRRNMTLAQLAEKTGQSRQNISNKMSRDNFTEKELRTIAEALNYTYNAHFVTNDTNETI